MKVISDTEYHYLMDAQADADRRGELLARCGHALASLDNSYPNELDVIDASLLDELAKELE